MPTPDTIAAEKERLYESSSLRDDLNDDEATMLLKWGETQVDRLAEDFPEEFEQKARFLRQLIKNINRFVGQREFNELEGQQKYMKKVVQYLEPLGWERIDQETIFAALPDDKADMAANLNVILNLLTPTRSNVEAQIIPVDDPAQPTSTEPTVEAQSNPHNAELENSNTRSINQSDNTVDSGDLNYYGEE